MCLSTLYHVNMTTQKVKIVRDKEVILTTYINRTPQLSGSSLNSRNPHNSQYRNKQRQPSAATVVINGSKQHINHLVMKHKLEANGYTSLNRKAELLKYSRHLRESAKPEAKPSLQSYNPEITSSNNQHIPHEIAVNISKKPKESRFGTCLGCSMTNLCKTLTIFKDNKEMKNKKRTLTGERGYRIEAFMKIMRLRKMK